MKMCQHLYDYTNSTADTLKEKVTTLTAVIYEMIKVFHALIVIIIVHQVAKAIGHFVKIQRRVKGLFRINSRGF